MFYSQLLLSKTGALGIVWTAAHCHKRLKKHQIQQADISSSVDKILNDGVPVITHRILAFLLLGVVRIYSKKVEYLFNDCHEILNRLCSAKTRKRKKAGFGVSLTHYRSISLPQRFELDTFDLDLMEGQDVAGGNVRSHEKHEHTVGRRKDVSTSGFLYKDSLQGNFPTSEAQSKGFTPPRDVFGPHHMDQNLSMGLSSNMKISLAGVEVLRGTHFTLEDCADPIILDEGEGQMHKNLTDEALETNFQWPINDMESDSDAHPSNSRSHLLPSWEILHGTEFALEDRLEPMVLDEAEVEQLDGRSSNHNTISVPEPLQDVEFVSVENQPPKGSDSVETLEVVHASGFGSKQFPNFQISNEADKGQGHDKPPDKEQRLEVENVEHLSLQFNSLEGEHHDFTASVDKAQPVDERAKVLEVITPDSVKCQRLEESHVSIVAPDPKLPGAGTSEVAPVQTPGRKERPKILKRQKILLDSTPVVPNKVFKNWINDSTDLQRKRRKIPHTILDAWRVSKYAHLDAWRVSKYAHFPQSFFEPSIPGISVDIECKRSCAPEIKLVEISSGQDGVKSPVTTTNGAPSPTTTNISPVREKSPGQTLHVRSPVREMTPHQTPIVPGTPLAHLDPLRSHEAEAVAYSDVIRPAASYESIEKVPSSTELLGFDALFQKETSSLEGDSLEKDAYSARTRMAQRYLGRKFLDKRIRGEEEVLNLSHLLAGKTKRESARLFYETLVLKTRDCIDVQQDGAYHDILLRGTQTEAAVSD